MHKERTLGELFVCSYLGFLGYLRASGVNLTCLYAYRFDLSRLIAEAIKPIEVGTIKKLRGNTVLKKNICIMSNKVFLLGCNELAKAGLSGHMELFDSWSSKITTGYRVESCTRTILDFIVDQYQKDNLILRFNLKRKPLQEILGRIGQEACDAYLLRHKMFWPPEWGDQCNQISIIGGLFDIENDFSEIYPLRQEDMQYQFIDPFQESKKIDYHLYWMTSCTEFPKTNETSATKEMALTFAKARMQRYIGLIASEVYWADKLNQAFQIRL